MIWRKLRLLGDNVGEICKYASNIIEIGYNHVISYKYK